MKMFSDLEARLDHILLLGLSRNWYILVGQMTWTGATARQLHIWTLWTTPRQVSRHSRFKRSLNFYEKAMQWARTMFWQIWRWCKGSTQGKRCDRPNTTATYKGNGLTRRVTPCNNVHLQGRETEIWKTTGTHENDLLQRKVPLPKTVSGVCRILAGCKNRYSNRENKMYDLNDGMVFAKR